TVIGDQEGFLLISSAAMPAMCGAAIEVPLSVSHRLPAWLGGALAAVTSTPGARMSGLGRSPLLETEGARDENAATWGASMVTCCAADSDAVAPAVAAYALMAAPATSSTCTVGT